MITKKGEAKNNQLLFGLLIWGYGSRAWLLEEMLLSFDRREWEAVDQRKSVAEQRAFFPFL
jgi:hypothetical protein